MCNKKVLLCLLMILSLLLFTHADLFARAGGAGGGHSHSGGHSGGGHSFSGGYSGGSHSYGGSSNSDSDDEGSGYGALVIVVILVIIIIVVYWSSRRNKVQGEVFKQLAVQKTGDQVKCYAEFIKNNPDFDENEFKKKVEKAFLLIQEAWSAKDLSGVRRFISDGVYQRFNTQFKMMEMLKQTDIISDAAIQSIALDRVESDRHFDVLTVYIRAGMADQFVCETLPDLNSPGGYEEFIEYWSFIRKRGTGKNDIYSTNNCPHCSAPLPQNMGDSGKCPYCGSFVNSGEYDWVLSEITQADDYAMGAASEKDIGDLNEKINELFKNDPDFSVQEIEDKAGNGYLQILTALSLQEPAIMRRFVSDSLFEKLKAQSGPEKILYNRIYLNDVTLIGATRQDDFNVLALGIRESFQRVRLSEAGAATLIDPVVMTRNVYLFLSRIAVSESSKGSIYAHLCSVCGAPVKDSLDIKCAYCNSVLNSGKNEWIITDMLSREEYVRYYEENKSAFEHQIDPAYADLLYDVKDYVLNNVMVIVAADGVFAESEKKMTEELAKKWGYATGELGALFDMARTGKLSIRMPANTAYRKKIFDLMGKAAQVDGRIDQSEQTILDHIKKTYDLS